VNASLPEEIAPAELNDELVEKLISLKKQGPMSLGMHPDLSVPIYVLSGPFGPYLQLGDVVEGEAKPKRVSIPKNINPMEVDFDLAMKLLELPKRLGLHPEDGKVVNAGIGRFGPYVQHAGRYKSLGKDDDILTVDLERAVELFKDFKGRAAQTPLKELGAHPDDGKPVAIFEGRYGSYAKWGKVNATIPKESDPQTITLDEVVKLLEARAGTSKKKTKKTAKTKAAPKAKAAPKKKAARKKKAAE